MIFFSRNKKRMAPVLSKVEGFTLIELPVVRKRAFTLIELIVVVAIIGILATVVVINISNAQNKAKDATVKANMTTVQTSAGLYENDNSTYVGLNCSPTSSPTCENLTATSEAMTSFVNAANSIKKANSEGLTFAGTSKDYVAFAKLPSTVGKTNTSFTVSSLGVSDMVGSVNKNLVGYWPMDEASGTNVLNAANPALYGTANASTTIGAGKFGNARHFSGAVVKNIDLGNTYSSVFTNSNAFTFSAWILQENNAAFNTIFARRCNGSTTLEYHLRTQGTGLVMLQKNASGYTSAAGGTIGLGTWTHVAATFDGATTKVYVSGVLKGSSSGSALSDAAGSCSTTIGSVADGTWPFFGSIDEMKAYNRALTDAEIKTLATL
jgi:prepilin-type N-terminal cleavage/methylation domain-containing protein